MCGLYIMSLPGNEPTLFVRQPVAYSRHQLSFAGKASALGTSETTAHITTDILPFEAQWQLYTYTRSD